ncbi:MAG: hypothetical protein ACJ8AW_37905, partial [Rhodopila sp.]
AAELSEEDVALLADLQGLRAAGPPLLPDLAPQRRKERMFAALLCQIERMARRQPVLIVVDDIHWIDPSSREWLDRLIERAGDWPVLLLALFRPEFQPPWAGQPRVTIMTLPRLDRRETTAMVASVAKAASRPADVLLAPEVVAQIAERTDGVPLFVEELTKAVLEAGEQAPGLLSAVPDPAVPVPAALHASLMARLDRLGATAREVAQAGAVIGREFSHTMLASIVGLPEPRLREALDRLTTAGLVFARGMPPGASYQFKHALVQDAAYGSLVRSRRQSLHQRAVAVIAEQMPDLAQAQPAMLAQHSAAAGLMKQAVTYWLKAARQADARSALPEAAAQARKGLEALSTLPDGPWRQQQELGLQYMLAVALTQAQGFPAAEIVRAFTRARALAEGLDRPEYVVRLISKQSGFHVMRAEYKQILSLGSEIESVGGIRGDTALTEVGLLWQGIARLYLGDIVAALAILEEHANPSNTPPELIYAGVHVAAIALTSRALAHLGHVDKARARLDEALSLTRRGGMSWLLAIVLLSANALDLLCGSPPAHVDELEALATEQGLLYYLSWALAFRGLTLDALGRAREASALLTEAFAQLSGRGAVTNLPMLLTWLARVSFRLGHPVEAWRYLAEARQRIETTGERVLEAEVLYRVPGDLLYAVGDLSEAERHYRQAIAVAERQSAKLLQLRAATSLARLLRDQGRRTEARDVLGPIYDWFTEGFDTPVLREARVLLDELA